MSASFTPQLYRPTAHQQRLIEQCKAGDPRAQTRLYRDYYKAMLRIAARLVGDDTEAEDVVQEAFVRAFRSLESFKAEATFGAWLKRIVINTGINHLKRRRTDWVPLEAEKFDLTNEEPEHVMSPWSMDDIHHAINQLPDGYRSVFQLYQFEGYDHKEIGRILNISEATSKSQFSRAKRKLRELLSRSPRMACA